MTRWARVGSSQKHKKLPEDATPWKDFWQNGNQKSTDDASRNKVKSGRIEKAKQKQKKMSVSDNKRKIFENLESKNSSKFIKSEKEEDESSQTSPNFPSRKETSEELFTTEFQVLSEKKSKKKAKLQQMKNTESNDALDQSSISSSADKIKKEHTTNEFQVLSKKQLRKAKKKAKLQELKNTESNDVQDGSSISISADKIKKEHTTNEFQGLSKKQLKKAKKKAKLQQLRNTELNDVKDNSSSNVADSTEISHTENESPREKDFQGKKKLFLKKLEKKRKENGILLLPSNVERKLYIIKKRLREKGLPPDVIRNVARKERRKEELKFRRSSTTKPCFNCRQIGHLLADCPMKLGNSNQETGLCFKCGSAEHTSYKCPEKIEGYPLAKCFVCKEQGHISKDCPKNKHGIYIKGGKCSLCGNVNHLQKDCPTLKKNAEEEDITAYTIHEGKSVDAEILPTDDTKSGMRTFVKKNKKAKLVKF